MSVPLRTLKADGTPYTRLAEIEVWLETLESLEAEQRLLRFAVGSRTDGGYVPSEALVYFLRKAWAADDKVEFEGLFRLLIKRVERALRAAVPDRLARAQDKRDQVRDQFVDQIAGDCGGSNKLDFYEVRFDLGLARLRKSALRPTEQSKAKMEPLGNEKGKELSADVEAAFARFINPNPSKLDDLAFRLLLTAAIDSLPSDQKQVIGLQLQGFPIDSKDKNVMTIARLINREEKTVRNRRDRAYRALRAILLVEIAP